ncbi:MAG TPA: MmgE/PrpD family protein [Gaiellaceae bacterium]
MDGLAQLADHVGALEVDAAGVDAVLRRVFDSLAAVEIGKHISDVGAHAGTGRDDASRVRFATAAARATEADDIHVRSCCTVGGVVVPATVLAARGPDDLVAGVVAGYEAMVRLALAIDGAALVYRGVWTSLLCAPVGVAAAVARARGLSAERTRSALALAVSRAVASAPEAGAGAPPRWWAIGTAAADGLLAADAAAVGVSAAPESVAMPVPCDAERLLEPLAPAAVLDVDTKAFPGARQSLAAVQAALAVAVGQEPDTIERVAIGVPAQVLAMVDRSRTPRNRLDSLVDVRYQVALALSRPEALLDAIREPPATAPELVARIDVAADDELTAAFPALGGRAELWAGGSSRSAVVEGVEPFGWAELEAKWEGIAAASGVEARLQALRRAAATGDPAMLAPLLFDGR